MKPDDQKLEQLVHQALRALPERRAPQALEGRILAAVEAQQKLPWWRQSVARWPLGARGALAALGVALSAALLVAGQRAGLRLPAAPAALFATLVAAREALLAVADALAAAVRGVPATWLYGLLAFLGLVYAALFGLGAAAYRTL